MRSGWQPAPLTRTADHDDPAGDDADGPDSQPVVGVAAFGKAFVKDVRDKFL